MIRSILIFCVFAASSNMSCAGESVRVMSFNIRYGSADDGDNRWDKRKTLVGKTISKFNPDLLGTQETLAFQAEYLGDHLPEYTYFGRSRMKTPNEHCGIFYKTKRFTWLAGGHFWLSESPDVPESKSWDSSLPRMATWILLNDNKEEHAKPILFVNTHFDHRGATAREEAARTIRHRINKIRAISDDPHVIVTGDFNAGEGSDPYKAFLDGNELLVDTYRQVHNGPVEGEGTFNGFRGRVDGPRIDWILASRSLECMSAEIDRTSEGNRYPSDHCPVNAVLEKK